jgi:hypothetical protein
LAGPQRKTSKSTEEIPKGKEGWLKPIGAYLGVLKKLRKPSELYERQLREQPTSNFGMLLAAQAR